MSEEENKAIENLKEVVELYNDKCLITTDDDFKSIEIILNIVEKQQKELEDLKDIQQQICNEELFSKEYVDELREEIEQLKNADLTTVYIRGVYEGEKKVKDKIRIKISYLLDNYDTEEDFCSYDVLITILESLLKEE